jgi:heme-degrading monooxygenase HmoA
MIARVWHGWAARGNAEAYDTLLRTSVLPALRRVEGYRGARVLRRPDGEETEFVTITVFDSIDAVRAFAGAEYDRAVVSPEARRLLSRFDERTRLYDLAICCEGPGRSSHLDAGAPRL